MNTHAGPSKQKPPNPSVRPMDQLALRRFAGHFPTGVAVVTACDNQGDLYGLTLNAVTSVSLDPPLYLICLSLASNTLRAIEGSGVFGVNFLHDNQEELARLFATKTERKFDAVSYLCGHRGVPLLDGTVAGAICSVEQNILAGDHRVVIGRLEDYIINSGQPLMFFKGQYVHEKPAKTGARAS